MMYRILVLLLKRNPLLHGGNSLKVLLLFLCLVWYATSGYLYFELPAKPDLHWSDALWWTLVTMTTVGYGDYFPESTAGRYLVGLPTMIFGIGFLGFIISELAAKFIESRSRRLQGMENTKAKDHIIIVNFSKYEDILNLISELKSDPSTQHKAICLIDEDLEQIPPRLADLGVHFVKGNPTRERVLHQAGLQHAGHVIVLAKDLSLIHI